MICDSWTLQKLKVTVFGVFIFFCNCYGQENPNIRGYIYGFEGALPSIHVINLNAKTGVISDDQGKFELEAKENDTILFSAINFKLETIIVNKNLVRGEPIEVFLEEKIIELSEVVVTPFLLTGSLSIDLNGLNVPEIISSRDVGLPYPEKKSIRKDTRYNYYSTSKKSTRRTFKDYLLGISAEEKKLDRLIHNSEVTNHILSLYPRSFFEDFLKIDNADLALFMHYCEIDADFQKVVKSKDKLKIWEELMNKSASFHVVYENAKRNIGQINDDEYKRDDGKF